PGLRERTVGHERRAVTDADAGRRRGGMERRGGQVLPSGMELLRELGRFPIALLTLGVVERVLISVDQQHVFHGVSPTCRPPSAKRDERNKMSITIRDGVGAR